ncbi:MAG: hypothetical protein JXN59_10275 [Anaerolineae bacterium]|nr:hypothetical protein [Anaerolineae bacterium]
MSQEPDLVVYFLVLLKKGPLWSPESTPEVEATQAAHLANIRALAEQGKLLLAGPFVDSPVDELRGLFILAAESHAEALALTRADPAVQAGRLAMDVIPWATQRGQLPGGLELAAYVAGRGE